MNTQRLYEYVNEALNDGGLSVQEKKALLYDFQRKTEQMIGVKILAGKDIVEVCEFIAHIKCRRSALANVKQP